MSVMLTKPTAAPPYSARGVAEAHTRCHTASENMVLEMRLTVSVKMAM